MLNPTYAQLKSKLQKELDLEDETFITEDEYLNYFNEGVDMIEALIHTIYEDYFLVDALLPLVSGTANYSLPSDIYANKIRLMVFNNGSDIYPIRRMKTLMETAQTFTAADPFKYIITNPTAAPKIRLYPTPAANAPTYVTLWYIRNAKSFALDADTCDIPEFTSVIVQYVRWKCLDKEGHPSTQSALADLERMKMDMVTTLTARVPDDDNEVLQDFSFYQDFDNFFLEGGF